AGVDVDAAETIAPAGTPVMMEAMSRSGGGRESGSTERAGSDQTKSKLTKHLHSPVWRKGRCCVPASPSDRNANAFTPARENRFSGLFGGPRGGARISGFPRRRAMARRHPLRHLRHLLAEIGGPQHFGFGPEPQQFGRGVP